MGQGEAPQRELRGRLTKSLPSWHQRRHSDSRKGQPHDAVAQPMIGHCRTRFLPARDLRQMWVKAEEWSVPFGRLFKGAHDRRGHD
jgi:hypothetical protein